MTQDAGCYAILSENPIVYEPVTKLPKGRAHFVHIRRCAAYLNIFTNNTIMTGFTRPIETIICFDKFDGLIEFTKIIPRLKWIKLQPRSNNGSTLIQ